jgi:putative FmdB family regulatory protein
MPIYEYLCNSCGVRKEHIQKMSDTPIKACPECGSTGYAKLISAAGFQLKGSGWYATDFKNKPVAAAKSEKNDAQTQSSESKTDSKATSESNSKNDATPPTAKSNETRTSATTPTATD